MTAKELITQIKDYADCADASYAMLHFVEQNEKIDYFVDKLKSENPNESVKPPARWLYADEIKQGYEITEDINILDKNQNIITTKKAGQPTAYALAIEARFSENIKIQKPKKDNPNELDKPQEIDNKIQSFIDRIKEDKEAKDQKILVALNKKQQDENPKDFTYHLSPRTKAFVSRFKLVSHQENTSISGYSHTIFKDTTKNDNTYILAFRGTEEIFKDMILTDVTMALLGIGLPQIISLMNYSNEVIKSIKEDYKSDDFKINVVGHSLGGHLAQSFCMFAQTNFIQKLYTYNAPGFAGALASALNIFIRLIRVVFKLLIRGSKKLFDILGFTRGVTEKCAKHLKIEGGTDTLIKECKNIQGKIEEKRLDECVLNIKKASKGKTNIEVHHIETIKNPIPTEESNKESFDRELRQTSEPTFSPISDLGYKYGLDIQDKFDYKNTDKLHLIRIGKIKGGFLGHSMNNIIWASYLYDYLFKCNDNLQELQGNIACVLNYLNEYSQRLIKISEENTLLVQYDTNINDEVQNYISVMLDEVFFFLCINEENLNKSYKITYGENTKEKKTENFSIDEYQKFNKELIPNAFLILEAMQISMEIMGENVIRNIKTDDLENNCYTARLLFKFLPFNVKDKEGKEILTRKNLYKALTYNSNCAKCIGAADNKAFFEARKKQMCNLLFGDKCTSFYLNKNQKAKEKICFNSMSSTAFVNIQDKEFFIFANNKDCIDCKEIYIRASQRLGINLEELQTYTPSIFFNEFHLTGSKELPNNPFYFGELNKDKSIKQDKPSYYFSPKDEESGLGRLSIFYKNNELFLLNYSIIQKSLNIKLECLSKESLEYEKLIVNSIKEQEHSQRNSKEAKAKLHALLENQNLECLHGGKVILKSNKGKSFKDKNIPIILESDLLNSKIINCPYTLAGTSYPCTQIPVNYRWSIKNAV